MLELVLVAAASMTGLLFTEGQNLCQQQNIRFNGESQTQVTARSAAQCEAECKDIRNCNYWTWKSGKCEIKRPNKEGDKVGSSGAVSGSRACSNGDSAQAIECKYKNSQEKVFCIFPFIGETPGRKNTGGSRHDNCLKTKRGHTWCATKVTQDNKLLGTSDQRRDIDCGQSRNDQGDLFCPLTGITNQNSAKQKTSTTPPRRKSQGSTKKKTNKNSCENRCGMRGSLGECQCNAGCERFGDCCKDYQQFCGTSSSSSKTTTLKPKLSFSDIAKKQTPAPASPATQRPLSSSLSCTPSRGTVPDSEIKKFSEHLLKNDENNVARLIQLNTGCSTRVGSPRDCSNQPLFSRVDTSIFRKPVYEKLTKLYNNYDSSTAVKEDRSRSERVEEEDFVDEVLRTKVMTDTLDFLKCKNLFTKSKSEFKKLINQLWFDLYSRGNRILGSSGFEHVFLGEKKAGKVQGFHNWVYFYFLEKQNQLNYLGHWEEVELGGRGRGLSFTFKWGDEQKPFASMMVGTSPELELALYTTCLLARGEEKCPLSLGGQPVSVETHVFTRPGGVRYVASSFMDWKP